MASNLLTALDIDNNSKSVSQQIEVEMDSFNKKRTDVEVKILRDKLKKQYPDNPELAIVSNESKSSIRAKFNSDQISIAHRKTVAENITIQADNYYELRKTLYGLNDLNEFSAEIERNHIQIVNTFPDYRNQLALSLKHLPLYKTMVDFRKTSITEYIAAHKGKKLQFQHSEDGLQLLLNMRELYKLDKSTDDIVLYEKYDMESNIAMANKLGQILLKRYSEDSNSTNLITEFAQKNNLVAKLAKSQVVSNKMLGMFLISNSDEQKNSFITNNSVTCLKTMYTTTGNNSKTGNNEFIYCTRTLGELLYEITNSDYANVDKSVKQQIYTTYDGTRPTSEEYYKWNGLQVLDIDLKPWTGSIDLLKQKMFEYLSEFSWFLWICKSASGNGIHIYTKVAPPHHVYIKTEENEYLSKYWFKLSYETKLSTVYDILYRINADTRCPINFPSNYFSAESNGFEMTSKIILDNGEKQEVGVDNSVGRITSGIRLTYDPWPLINNNFVDLHVGLNLCQTLDGYDYTQTINKVLLRETPLSIKHRKEIDDLALETTVENLNKEKTQQEIDLSHVTLGHDINKRTTIPRSGINYQVRYNVCNTLAAIMGKDGLQIAHELLDSKGCRNVGEINAFYSCALSNTKKPSKFGLDLLKKHGIINSVKPELKEEVTNIFKNGIKLAIENALNNLKVEVKLALGPKEYLSDKKLELANPVTGLRADKINIILSPPGSGKCLGKDTPVLMYDCTTKMVQDIVVGDVLMGWDSKPRNVLSTTQGQEEMFKVTPKKGDPWACNKSHILSVIESGVYNGFGGKIPNSYDIEDMDVRRIQNLPINHRKKLLRVPLDFPKQDVRINPYWLGLWLGDGHTMRCDVAVGDIDKDVTVPLLEAYAKQLGCKLTRYEDFREGHNVSSYNIVKPNGGKGESPLSLLMNSYNLFGNKHIPKEYLQNDRKTRLLVFAGLIDSDGGGSDGTYDYVTKLDSLKDDMLFLCRSLGYYVNCKVKIVGDKPYWRLTISGDFTDLPVRLARKKFIRKINKNALVTGFSIESIGMGDYYGFSIDGDKRFMLGDFTVTHNTEYIKTLAKDGKRVLLVLPYVSVIKNKIETDPTIMHDFECYYGSKDITKMDYGINAVTTFDKFSKSSYERIAKMFDYIFIDESHLLFTSSYRIESTSASVKKLKDLFWISSNDPYAAKICLLTGTETGESYFFGDVSNIIRVSKTSLQKTMEYMICDDLLDSQTRMADKVYQLLTTGYKILVPTNKGEIYTEKLMGMIHHLMQRPVKYGYYKRSNTDQEICQLINNENTIGNYELVFCTNYLSVGVDINDKFEADGSGLSKTTQKFASIYLGPFAGYEIEQFNARIRKTGIDSFYCIQTETADGGTNDLLLEEPSLLLKITQDDLDNFADDKSIAGAKQEFLAQYDPILHKIVTPGFSFMNKKIMFNLEEYELTSFETKYKSCMEHPVKVARELDRYGYSITVSTEYDGLTKVQQEELRAIGIASAREEKIRKHSLYVGTFIDLVNNNTLPSECHTQEDVIEWILKHPDSITEDREMEDPNVFVMYNRGRFGELLSVVVRSREALDKMIQNAKYLVKKYSVHKALDIFNQWVDENGVLNQKDMKRGIDLLRLVDKSDMNELAEPLAAILSKAYVFLDEFEADKNYRISYDTYKSKLDEWTNHYIDISGMKINTQYGFDKIQDTLVAMLGNISNKSTGRLGIRFSYNKMPDQNSMLVQNRRSVDSMIQTMFHLTSSGVIANKTPREKHILVQQTF